MYVRMKNLFIILISSVATLSYAAPMPTYDGAEHIEAGNQVALKFANNQPAIPHYHFTLSNGLNVSYGDILSLGDFYGNPQQPIVRGKNDIEKKERFIKAFNDFALRAASIKETQQILEVLHHEQAEIHAALQRGDDVEKVSKSLSVDNARKLNCITGGGCSETWFLKPGRYLQLARIDYDHFSHNALTAYQVGHALAIEYAITAHLQHDESKLQQAYAVNAFASHFLSDLFAAGHLRTPRVKLPLMVNPSLTGSLLAGFMHIEENAYGLHVKNKLGTEWIAYGDHGFFSNKNMLNKSKLLEALQRSADEVFAAYQSGTRPMDEVSDLVPYPTETKNHNLQDISPLFYFDETKNKLLRRQDVANPFDRHYTANWWGWSTLSLLGAIYGIPPEAQGALANSAEQKTAETLGLIPKHFIS